MTGLPQRGQVCCCEAARITRSLGPGFSGCRGAFFRPTWATRSRMGRATAPIASKIKASTLFSLPFRGHAAARARLRRKSIYMIPEPGTGNKGLHPQQPIAAHGIKNQSRSFERLCVGVDLFSRLVAKQVSSALVSLTSVFGMGTGGPSPLKTPTMSEKTSFPFVRLAPDIRSFPFPLPFRCRPFLSGFASVEITP